MQLRTKSAMPKVAIDAKPSAAARLAPSYAEFGQDTIDAAMKTNAALNDGIEAIGEEVAQYARAAFESAGETARGLLGARTLEDVVRVQSEFAKRSIENFVECSVKLSELGYLLVGASVGAWDARAKR
jgi:hypothetical protein